VKRAANVTIYEPPCTWPVRTVVWDLPAGKAGAHSVSFWRSRLLDCPQYFNQLC